MQRYKSGADSVRGQLLIVLGTPSRVSPVAGAGESRRRRQHDPRASTRGPPTSRPPRRSTTRGPTCPTSSRRLSESARSRPRSPSIRRRAKDTLDNQAEVEKAMAIVAEKSIVNPNATLASASAAGPKGAAPAAGTAAGALAAAAAAAAPAVATMPLPAAVKTALEGVAGKSTGDAGFWAGTFRSASGDQFLALQFYLASNKPTFSRQRAAQVRRRSSRTSRARKWTPSGRTRPSPRSPRAPARTTSSIAP